MVEIRPDDFKRAISTTSQPLVIRNFQLDWHIFKISLEEWCGLMDQHNQNERIPFTTATTKHCDLPYWERFRVTEYTTFNEFLAMTGPDRPYWHSHGYKDISCWPEALRESVSFEKLGFPKEQTEDILYWFGSAGANTPCHYDTYGFNIVVQVYGRKNWLLFPPTTNLTATRVPYEESSVYCKQNFYSPLDMDQFDVIAESDAVFEVTLNPGDILIVPPNYWHYVENVETSLAVNTWIPLEKHDAIARLGECFVRIQVDKITEEHEEDARDDLRSYIYNPNEKRISDTDLFNLFKPLADATIANEGSEDFTRVEKEAGHTIRRRFPEIFHKVEQITRRRFEDIMSNNSLRHEPVMEERKLVASHFLNVENIINAICHPITTMNACEIYTKQIREEAE